MRNDRLPALLAALLLAGCGTMASGTNTGRAATRAMPVAPITEQLVPAGTPLDVILNDSLNPRTASIGDRFSATVSVPLLTAMGRPAIPAGATITGLVTGIDAAESPNDPAYLRLNFVRITIEDANHPFAAEIIHTDLASRAGMMPVPGAPPGPNGARLVVGGIVDGDLRELLQGGTLGPGAGSIIALGSASEQLPAGTEMRIRTLTDVSLER